jgi:hypothetical protein
VLSFGSRAYQPTCLPPPSWITGREPWALQRQRDRRALVSHRSRPGQSPRSNGPSHERPEPLLGSHLLAAGMRQHRRSRLMLSLKTPTSSLPTTLPRCCFLVAPMSSDSRNVRVSASGVVEGLHAGVCGGSVAGMPG